MESRTQAGVRCKIVVTVCSQAHLLNTDGCTRQKAGVTLNVVCSKGQAGQLYMSASKSLWPIHNKSQLLGQLLIASTATGTAQSRLDLGSGRGPVHTHEEKRPSGCQGSYDKASKSEQTSQALGGLPFCTPVPTSLVQKHRPQTSGLLAPAVPLSSRVCDCYVGAPEKVV